jgi:hypothetical protein
MAGVVGYTMSLGAKNIKKCMLRYKPAVFNANQGLLS